MSKPEFNGCKARVGAFDAATGRHHVALEDGKVLALTLNLTLALALTHPSPSPNSNPHSPQALALKPSNLVALAVPPGQPAPL